MFADNSKTRANMSSDESWNSMPAGEVDRTDYTTLYYGVPSFRIPYYPSSEDNLKGLLRKAIFFVRLLRDGTSPLCMESNPCSQDESPVAHKLDPVSGAAVSGNRNVAAPYHEIGVKIRSIPTELQVLFAGQRFPTVDT